MNSFSRPALTSLRTPRSTSAFRYTEAVCRFAMPASTMLPMRRLHEDRFNELATVERGRALANPVGRGSHQVTSRADLLRGPRRRFLDSCQHVENPGFPRIVTRHGTQETVVLAPAADNRAAHVQHGQVQQALLNQVQQVQYATRSTIAVGERVNGFE